MKKIVIVMFIMILFKMEIYSFTVDEIKYKIDDVKEVDLGTTMDEVVNNAYDLKVEIHRYFHKLKKENPNFKRKIDNYLKKIEAYLYINEIDSILFAKEVETENSFVKQLYLDIKKLRDERNDAFQNYVNSGRSLGGSSKDHMKKVLNAKIDAIIQLQNMLNEIIKQNKYKKENLSISKEPKSNVTNVQCYENMKLINESVDLYNLSADIPFRIADFSKLISNELIDKIPVCPENGEYSWNSGVARCTKHGFLNSTRNLRIPKSYYCEYCRDKLENLVIKLKMESDTRINFNLQVSYDYMIFTELLKKGYLKKPARIGRRYFNKYRCRSMGRYSYQNGRMKCTYHSYSRRGHK